jgi:hypothetical protein
MLSDTFAPAPDRPETDLDVFDLIQYSTDKKGRTNFIKFGRLWLPADSTRGRIKFFALPLTNQYGECIADIVLRQEPKAGET